VIKIKPYGGKNKVVKPHGSIKYLTIFLIFLKNYMIRARDLIGLCVISVKSTNGQLTI
jgi:hypothetical protein